MFIIIGGDGKEYGPVTADQVRAWIAAGRANAETKAKLVGSDDWRRLAEYPEFASPGGAPPMIGSSPAGTATATIAMTTATIPDPLAAERGTRLVARLIDWVIEMLCAVPGGLILGGEMIRMAIAMSQGRQPNFEDLDLQRVLLGGSVLAVTSLALLVVQVWMLTTRGQSIGKRIMKIRIVRLNGDKPGIVFAWVMRELLITIIGIFLSIIPFIGPLFLRPIFHLVDWCMIFRDDQRCLHDVMAGTRVIKASNAA